ncbi:MAG TPA: SAM-dependent methyltransferase [Microvirga sp.]|nr:SAM-dependent methyltransferase [Microvirga sp.]
MSALGDRIRALIGREGPLTVERYMGLCLQHYYASRDPLGLRGDFTTSPEISQMFGELLGLWAASVWQGMGAPGHFRLAELGPGRGTLMVDALRALRRVPGLLEGASVHLVETSPALRERQRAALAPSGAQVSWHEHVEAVPPGPMVALANEFFDALPIRQFAARAGTWHERVVESADGSFRFGLSPAPEPSVAVPAREGATVEVPEAGAALMRILADRLVRDGGAALVIDYGYWGPAFGDTLQALKAHAFADPLAEPGEADLTAHVDFHHLARAAAAAGAVVHGPLAQGDFLRGLGIEVRAQALKARATPEQAQAVEAGLRRLTDPEGMGELFKVLAISHPGLPPLPGLRPNPMTDQEDI